MAYMITEQCINCFACFEDCPMNAITKGDYYKPSKINPMICNECEGVCDFPACLEVCPIDAITLNPAFIESKNELYKKGKYIKEKLFHFNDCRKNIEV